MKIFQTFCCRFIFYKKDAGEVKNWRWSGDTQFGELRVEDIGAAQSKSGGIGAVKNHK